VFSFLGKPDSLGERLIRIAFRALDRRVVLRSDPHFGAHREHVLRKDSGCPREGLAAHDHLPCPMTGSWRWRSWR
jgi:hypothetical protein